MTNNLLDEFFDKEQHHEKIHRNAQKIRNSQPMAQAKQYLHDLFDYFISDINEIAKQVYEEAILRHSAGQIDVTPTHLRNEILKITESFLDNYNRIIQSYNSGCMFRDYENAAKDIESFKTNAKKTCEKQSWVYSTKYKSHLGKALSEKSMLAWSKIAGITGALGLLSGLIFGIGSIYTSINNTTNQKPASTSENNNPITYSYTGYIEKILATHATIIEKAKKR